MATTTGLIRAFDAGKRVVKPDHVPVDHRHLGKKGDGKGWEYIQVLQTDRTKAYSSNRTKPRKKKK